MPEWDFRTQTHNNKLPHPYNPIKSIIETAKKQSMDILYVFSEIVAGNHNVFDLQVD